MDWQPIIIAVLGSTGLQSAVHLMKDTGPEKRRLQKAEAAARHRLEKRESLWEQFMLRLRRWHTRLGIDEADMPTPPEPLDESE